MNPSSVKNIQPLKVPGSYHPLWSVNPFKEGLKMAGHSFKLAEKGRKKYNSSVFKMHPGLKSIFCCDHISVEFFLNASQDLLERESTSQDIVGLHFRKEFIGKAELALTAYGKEHSKLRALTDAILSARPERKSAIFETVSAALFSELAEKKTIGVKDFIRELVGRFLFKWLLDVDLSAKELSDIELNAATIKTDGFVANILSKAVTPKCPFHVKETNDKVSDLIQKSSFFETYKSLAKNCDVSTKTLADFLKGTLIFNGTGAAVLGVLHSIVRVSDNENVANRLMQELAGKSEKEMLENDYLEHVILECHRLGNQPLFTARRAQKDFLLPANGQKFYQIKKGDLLSAQIRNAHLDPVVFQHPEEFNPDRFTEYPMLKKKVFPYSTSPNGANPFGCAAAGTGLANWLMKMILTKCLVESSFQFSQKPQFDKTAFLSFRPSSIEFRNFCWEGKLI